MGPTTCAHGVQGDLYCKECEKHYRQFVQDVQAGNREERREKARKKVKGYA